MTAAVSIEGGPTAIAPTPRIALCGNPNTGKTSLFNSLTGGHARVGNYPGVTVDLLKGRWALPEVGEVELVDVPGSYSLLARSMEEQIAVDDLLGLHGHPRPDVVVACVDATNLLRNLYFVLQLQELSLNVVVALTMTDELDTPLPVSSLVERLGCPVVPISTRKGVGIDDLADAVERALVVSTGSERLRFEPSAALSREIARVRAALPPEFPNTRGMALWALMSWDREVENAPASVVEVIEGATVPGEAIDDEVIEGRYRFLDAELGPLVETTPARPFTRAADRVLIHPVWGFGIFLAIMFVLFQSLFAWSDPAIGLIEEAFSWLSSAVATRLPDGITSEFIVNGVIGGVGSVVVFLPQILLLFFLLGLLEDSGYLARVAYLMDRIMRMMGLHGRAFVPMLSGFACAIPAIMATRAMEQKRDRLLTMMVIPLMTCSARLPVYTLIIGALFPAATVMGFLPLQGTLMVSMYFLSVVMALVAAFVLSKTVLTAPPVPLVLELPPYRLPRVSDVIRMMWRRTRFFLSEAGGIILVCSMILWVLLNFPRNSDLEARIAAEAAAPGASVEQVETELASERLRNSYAGQLGHALAPVIEPLGFDWKIGVGLIGAFAAREVFVATMGIVYSAGTEVDESDVTLRQRMRAEVRDDGRPVYSGLTGLSLMVFFALACQCVSTIAVVKRETGGYRWPLFLFTYMTGLAWVSSFAVFQVGRLLGYG